MGGEGEQRALRILDKAGRAAHFIDEGPLQVPKVQGTALSTEEAATLPRVLRVLHSFHR